MEGSFPFCHQKKFHADGLMLGGESGLWLATELNVENINTARTKKNNKNFRKWHTKLHTPGAENTPSLCRLSQKQLNLMCWFVLREIPQLIFSLFHRIVATVSNAPAPDELTPLRECVMATLPDLASSFIPLGVCATVVSGVGGWGWVGGWGGRAGLGSKTGSCLSPLDLPWHSLAAHTTPPPPSPSPPHLRR